MIFIRLDENVSHKIGLAAELIGIQRGITFESPHSMNELQLPDHHWMALMGARGGPRDVRIAFSGDGFNEAERATAEINNITVFYTPKMFWRPLGCAGQAAYFLRWLPTIIAMAKANAKGTQFQLPRSFNVDADVTTVPRILAKKVVRPGRPKKPRTIAPAPLLDR